jgi:hypothetical protein
LCARQFRSWTERSEPLNNSEVYSIHGGFVVPQSSASHRRGLGVIQGLPVWDLRWRQCTGTGFFSTWFRLPMSISFYQRRTLFHSFHSFVSTSDV